MKTRSFLSSVMAVFSVMLIFSQWHATVLGSSVEISREMFTPYLAGSFVIPCIANMDVKLGVPSSPTGVVWGEIFNTAPAMFVSVFQTADGGYVALADENYVVKTDSAGKQLWVKDIETSGSLQLSRGMRPLPDDGYIIFGNDTATDQAQLTKIDGEGNLVWSTMYNVTFAQSERFTDVQITPDGGLLAFGTRSLLSTSALSDAFWLVKVDHNGVKQWEKLFFDGVEDSMLSQISTQSTFDGEYVVAFSYSDTEPLGVFDSHILMKIDNDGNVVWEQAFSPEGEAVYISSVAQTSDGGFVLSGAIDQEERDFWLLKTDSSGNEVWRKSFGGCGGDFHGQLLPLMDGGYVFLGYKYYKEDQTDVYLIKFDNQWNQLWKKFIEINGRLEWALDIQETDDAGFIISGGSAVPGEGNNSAQPFLIKTDSRGRTLSEIR